MFFNEKETKAPEELLRENKQVVIFNSIDHESIITANIYKALAGLADIKLLDIRDPIIQADAYLFLGVGTREKIFEYYSGSIPNDTLTSIMESSVFIERPGLMQKLSQLLQKRDGVGPERFALLTKWETSSKLFYQITNETERLVRYYHVLELCHRAHDAGTDASEEVSVLSCETSKDDIDAFCQRQKMLNNGLVRKIRYISYPVKGESSVPFIHTTTMSWVIYTILRRAMWNKKNYIHQSMGVYGQVVFSNRQFDTATFNTGSAKVLYIQGE